MRGHLLPALSYRMELDLRKCARSWVDSCRVKDCEDRSQLTAVRLPSCFDRFQSNDCFHCSQGVRQSPAWGSFHKHAASHSYFICNYYTCCSDCVVWLKQECTRKLRYSQYLTALISNILAISNHTGRRALDESWVRERKLLWSFQLFWLANAQTTIHWIHYATQCRTVVFKHPVLPGSRSTL